MSDFDLTGSISNALARLKNYAPDPVSEVPAPPAQQSAPSQFELDVRNELWRIGSMLVAKNKSYGNSVFQPVHIFSRAHPMDQMLARIDDKLARVKSGKEFPGDDTIDDLIGYLVLFRLGQKVYTS